MITLLFNQAFMYEKIADYGKATQFYKDIIKINPNYIDSYLRIAFIAMKNNDYLRAMNYV